MIDIIIINSDSGYGPIGGSVWSDLSIAHLTWKTWDSTLHRVRCGNIPVQDGVGHRYTLI